MQSAIEAPSVDPAGHAAQTKRTGLGIPISISAVVAIGAQLFQPGDHRRLYRVESGAICHYARLSEANEQVIEFAFPGDIIGLGYLPTHVSTAAAMVDTSRVSVDHRCRSRPRAHKR